MAEFVPRKIQKYIANVTVPSARDINDIVARIERLEKFHAVLPLKITNKNPYNIALTHEVHECKLVVLQQDIIASRNVFYYGHQVELDMTGYYGAGSNRLFKLQENTNIRYRFRNPLLFTGSYGDWAFIVKMPSLGDDYFLIQIMCPGAVVDPDESDYTANPFVSWPPPQAAAGGYSARYHIPVPLIPGFINAD